MRRSIRSTLALLAVSLLVAGSAWAQGAVSTRISGQVVGADGDGLPGVTVTFTSPVLQGAQVVITEVGGHYTSPPIPPGAYTVSFDLAGFQPVAMQVRATAGSTTSLDATLEQVEIREEITVTGDAVETVSSTSTSSQTLTSESLEELPTGQDITAATGLAAGVTPGVNGLQIAGAQSWDNLYTLDGVTMNENLRGQPRNRLYIDDAIQEVTVQSGGISTEYGRFSGGVVTAITKVGGNDFSGSLRMNLTNDDWRGSNRLSPERIDQTNENYEATLGGRFIRDRLWYFGSARTEETDANATSNVLNLPYVRTLDEDRFGLKLTGSVTPAHQLQVTYNENDATDINVPHGGLNGLIAVTDDGSLDAERGLPEELRVLSYTGILSDEFFLEAYYGEREFAFEGTGGTFAGDFGEATPIGDAELGVFYNESLFCGTCADEERDNEQGRVKGTYFASTESTGAHDLVFGFETFTDIRKSDNHQSATNWWLYSYAPSIEQGDRLVPVLESSASTQFVYWPILNPSQGTDFQSDGVFVNDSWRLNDAWSFNLGVRWDQTDATNSNGAQVAKDDGFSPRLGATWTPGGDSPWNLHLYAGRYIGLAASGVFDNSSPAGNPALFVYQYGGPAINTGGGALVDPDDAVRQTFDWLFDTCPALLDAFDPNNPVAPPASTGSLFDCSELIFVDIPGGNLILDDNLSPVSADELKIGFSRSLGNIGVLRADLVRREWNDLFVDRRDLTTGKVTDANGNLADLGVQINSDVAKREYLGLDLAANLGLLDRRLRVGGSLTVSELEGNLDGETRGAGPVSTGLLEFPEYTDLSWNAPEGRLGTDKPVRLRAWAAYDLLQTTRHRLTASLLQSFDAGSPYGASGSIDTRPFVTNPGYEIPPTSVTYFFTDRDAFELDDITSTDISLNYGISFGRWEVFVQPELLNVFNEDGVDGGVDGVVNTTIFTAFNDPSLEEFNPFTQTPVEGVHWRKGSNFGQPTSEDDLQDPREFRVSIGFKFNP